MSCLSCRDVARMGPPRVLNFLNSIIPPTRYCCSSFAEERMLVVLGDFLFHNPGWVILQMLFELLRSLRILQTRPNFFSFFTRNSTPVAGVFGSRCSMVLNVVNCRPLLQLLELEHLPSNSRDLQDFQDLQDH